MDNNTGFREQIITAFLSQQKAQDPSQSNVCRALFGPGDPELNKKVARIHMEQQIELMEAKYNFNFNAETALEGKYKWELLTDLENVPHIYRPQQMVRVNRNTLPLSVQNNCSQNLSACENSNACVQSSQDIASPSCVQNVTSSAEPPVTSYESTSVLVSSEMETLPSSSDEAETATQCSEKRKQSLITDYFSVKKRRRSDPDQKYDP